MDNTKPGQPVATQVSTPSFLNCMANGNSKQQEPGQLIRHVDLTFCDLLGCITTLLYAAAVLASMCMAHMHLPLALCNTAVQKMAALTFVPQEVRPQTEWSRCTTPLDLVPAILTGLRLRACRGRGAPSCLSASA